MGQQNLRNFVFLVLIFAKLIFYKFDVLLMQKQQILYPH